MRLCLFRAQLYLMPVNSSQRWICATKAPTRLQGNRPSSCIESSHCLKRNTMRLSMASPFLNGSRSSKSLVMEAPETTKYWAVLVLLGDQNPFLQSCSDRPFF